MSTYQYGEDRLIYDPVPIQPKYDLTPPGVKRVRINSDGVPQVMPDPDRRRSSALPRAQEQESLDLRKSSVRPRSQESLDLRKSSVRPRSQESVDLRKSSVQPKSQESLAVCPTPRSEESLENRRRSSVRPAPRSQESVDLRRSSLRPRSQESCARDPEVEVRLLRSKSCESLCGPPVPITRLMLYKEALYTANHMLGHPSDRFPTDKNDLTYYVQTTFAADPEEQRAYTDLVLGEDYPLTVVNVGIRRAEGLPARDRTGLSDPYCLLSVETDLSLDRSTWTKIQPGSPKNPNRVKKNLGGVQRPVAENRLDQLYVDVPKSIRTTVKHKTLDPVWEQRFQCIAMRPDRDVLNIEVWDHDDDPEVLADLTGVKKNSAHFKGRKDDFIGKIRINVKDIPVEGEEKWHYLEGQTHRGTRAQGQLLAQVWLTHAFRHGHHHGEAEYGCPKAFLERMWDVVLAYEQRKKGDSWDGTILHAPSLLLFQYGLQNGISEATQTVIEWKARNKLSMSLYGTGVSLQHLDTCLSSFTKLGNSEVEFKDLALHELELSIQASLLLPFQIIRNHFHETQLDLEEAIKDIRHARHVLAIKLGSMEEVARLDFEYCACLRMAVLEWYQAKFLQLVVVKAGTSRHEVVGMLSQVVREVVAQLDRGVKVWSPMFTLQGDAEGRVQYLPIIYDEFQKMIVHDVELMVASTVQPYRRNNDLLRRMLLEMSEPTGERARAYRDLCRALRELYNDTQVFASAQDDIFSQRMKCYEPLNSCHVWFRPALCLWLGFTFIVACERVAKGINIDEVVREDNYVSTSSSAVDTTVVLILLSNFLSELSWPDLAEAYVITHFVLEIMVYVTVLYARLKRQKIDQEGYFDTLDRFDISDRLCTALNNIQYVQEKLLSVPQELKFEENLRKLEAELRKEGGGAVFDEKKSRVTETLALAVVEVEKEFIMIMAGIGNRVRPEIKAALEETFVVLQHGPPKDDALGPLFSYLDSNLNVLVTHLRDVNFGRFLQMFWRVLCEELRAVATHFPATTSAEQRAFFSRLEDLFPPLIAYFTDDLMGLSDREVNGPEFTATRDFMRMFTMDSRDLVSKYYMLRAQEQLTLTGEGKYGSIQARVSYYNGKLTVEVISAKHLLPMDTPSRIRQVFQKVLPKSDPKVEVEVLVRGMDEGASQSTSTRWKTLNPVYEETFSWDLDPGSCQQPSSVVRFTVRDVDVVSRNDFLGEAIIPIAQIPGVAKEKPIRQPMSLQLTSTERLDNVLLVLSTRTWEPESDHFVTKQLKRAVEPSSP